MGVSKIPRLENWKIRNLEKLYQTLYLLMVSEWHMLHDYLIVAIFHSCLNSPRNGCYWSFFNPLKSQPHKMVKHTQAIRRQEQMNCLSIFDHFVGLVHKRLLRNILSVYFFAWLSQKFK